MGRTEVKTLLLFFHIFHLKLKINRKCGWFEPAIAQPSRNKNSLGVREATKSQHAVTIANVKTTHATTICTKKNIAIQ